MKNKKSFYKNRIKNFHMIAGHDDNNRLREQEEKPEQESQDPENPEEQGDL